MLRPPRLTLAAGLLALGVLAACSDATGTRGARPVSLSFSTAPSSGVVAALGTAAAGDPLVITRAQLVISRTELEQVGATCASNLVENDDDGCAELKLGPMLVDLPLTAGAKTALTVTLPEGSYSGFESKIDAVSSETDGPGQEAAAFLAAHPELRNVSIRVEGTYNGQPFVYTTNMDVGLEMSFSPALVIDASSSNMTLDVDLSTWFRAQDGSSIDPATANDGGANKSVVEGNIKRSIKVFEDDDRNGRDD